MSRTFAYVRVSTMDQTTENQVLEIENAGFKIQPQRIVAETISGGTAMMLRPGFVRLLDRLESGDVLVVTKMDRLGRNAVDVSSTVAELASRGIRVHCLALGGVDLTSPAGKMTMGKILGRRSKLTSAQKKKIVSELVDKISISQLARKYGVSRMTIARVRREANAEI